MNIPTKYELGDEVWFIVNASPVRSTIDQISVRIPVGNGSPRVLYHTAFQGNDSNMFLESAFYSTLVGTAAAIEEQKPK